MTEPVNPGDLADANRRQVLYWRLLGRLFDPDEQPGLESTSMAVVDDLGLPAALLDPAVSVDTVVQRFPALADELRGLLTGTETVSDDAGPFTPGQAEVRRAALVSKVLLNVFATGTGPVSAGQLARWQSDAGWFEQALGHEPGELRRQGGGQNGGLGATLARLEGDLVRRMHLREVLADPALARQLTPSMSLIEQLLRDKANLSGVALANAKALIRRFVDEVAEVLRTQVEQHQRRHDRPVGAAEAGLPQPRPRPHHLEEPDQLEPRGRAALRRPALLPADGPQDHARRG